MIYALESALVFSLLGVAVLGLTFWLVDRVTPGSLWEDVVEKNNTEVAILGGSIAIAISLIISAAIHG